MVVLDMGKEGRKIMQKDEALKILEHRNGGYTWKDIENAIAVTVEALISKQPIQIDREAWQPCEKCKTCASCISSTESAKDPKSMCFNCQCYGNHRPRNFCPNCGRPLTPEAWAELEKRLRG